MGAAALASASVAYAAGEKTVLRDVTVSPTSGEGAFGAARSALGSAADGSNGASMRCETAIYPSSPGAPPDVDITCTFVDQNGAQFECYSQQPWAYAALALMDNDSMVRIEIDPASGSNDCSSFIVTNGSAFQPKTP